MSGYEAKFFSIGFYIKYIFGINPSWFSVLLVVEYIASYSLKYYNNEASHHPLYKYFTSLRLHEILDTGYWIQVVSFPLQQV